MATAASPELLRQVKLFQQMRDDELQALCGVLRPMSLPVGDTVFRQGDPGKTMIVLADGILRVEVVDNNGHKANVGTIRPGEIVGEMAVFDPAPRSATVVTATGCTVYELSLDGLKQLQQTAPSVSATIVGAVIGDVTRRLRKVNLRIDGELDPASKDAPSKQRITGQFKAEAADAGSFFSRLWAKVSGT